MLAMYLTFLALSSLMGSTLSEEVDKLLEKKGYVGKNRVERVKRAASGNIIEYSVTVSDVRNWFKKNIWYFLPVFHFVPIIAFCVRHISYEDKGEKFFQDWLEFLIGNEYVVACSEEEIESIHTIEEELKNLKGDKIGKFLSKIGVIINVSETIEEQDEDLEEYEDTEFEEEDTLEQEELEDEELEQHPDVSSIEITINTSLGSKKFYRVIDSKKRGSRGKSQEDETVDKIMDCLDREFDCADQRIDKAMDCLDRALDSADERIDKVMDKVDKALEKILKL